MERGRDLDAELDELIERFGWAVRHVTATPPFSYTIGLTDLDHPEIVITGMPFEAAQAFLNLVGESVRDGAHFGHGDSTNEFSESGEVLFIRAEDQTGLAAVRDRFPQHDALQLVWPDSTGAFPWQPGYRNSAADQPLLGPVPDGRD